MRTYEGLRAEMEAALGEAYRKHFGEPVEVQVYRMVTKKRGERKAE